MIGSAALAAQLLVPESRTTTPGRINWLAAVLLSGWLVALLIAASEAPTWGWGSGKVLGLLAATVVLAVVWVVVESRSANPLIDMKMMRIRAVWTTNLVALLFGVGLYAMFAFLPEFLQTPSSAGYGFGSSITESGLMILPQAAAMFLIGSDRRPRRSKGRVQSAGSRRFGTQRRRLRAHRVRTRSQVGDLPVQRDIGVGFGFAFTAMSNLIVAAVPPEQTGVASGMNANIRTIGGSLGAAFMASIVTSGVHAGSLPKESGYTHGFLMLGAALLLSALAALLIPTARRTRPTTAADLPHAELALIAGGTLIGDEPE